MVSILPTNYIRIGRFSSGTRCANTKLHASECSKNGCNHTCIKIMLQEACGRRGSISPS